VNNKTKKGRPENLKSLAERTTEEQREIAKKGVDASKAARAKRKALREELLAILDLQVKGKANSHRLSLALFNKGLKGDVKAFEAIRDTIGEKPVDNIVVESNETVKQVAELMDTLKEPINGNSENNQKGT